MVCFSDGWQNSEVPDIECHKETTNSHIHLFALQLLLVKGKRFKQSEEKPEYYF